MNVRNDIHTPDPFSWTGSRDINLLDPDPNDFIVSEIARSLSRRPRYGGFSDVPVSIAAHTLICDAILLEEAASWRPSAGLPSHWRRGVLIHDWPEAYLSDIQRPLKRTAGFDAYRELEEVYVDRMTQRWSAFVPRSVLKKIDNLALAAEVHIAMPAVLGRWTSLPEPTKAGLAAAHRLLQSAATPNGVERSLVELASSIGVE